MFGIVQVENPMDAPYIIKSNRKPVVEVFPIEELKFLM